MFVGTTLPLVLLPAEPSIRPEFTPPLIKSQISSGVGPNREGNAAILGVCLRFVLDFCWHQSVGVRAGGPLIGLWLP
jgi:hypothetical protein